MTAEIHYQTKDFDVVILPALDYPVAGIQGKAFSPSLANVDSAEGALKRDLKDMNSFPNKLVSYNLKKYRRQYLGYIDSTTGHKILYINCFWKSFKYRVNWLYELVDISEGGGYYWNISYDLTAKKLFDFWVHGRE